MSSKIRETLMKAAEALELVLSKTTEGPWAAVPNTMIGGWALVEERNLDRVGEGPYFGEFVKQGDALYVAAMDPRLGRALVQMLRVEAGSFSRHVNHAHCAVKECPTIAAFELANEILASVGAAARAIREGKLDQVADVIKQGVLDWDTALEKW